jgi:hypothetical protein
MGLPSNHVLAMVSKEYQGCRRKIPQQKLLAAFAAAILSSLNTASATFCRLILNKVNYF